MNQTQSLKKKSSANNSTQALQRSGTKNNTEALDKKTDNAAAQDEAPLQKKAYRTALSSGQSAAQEQPRLQTKLSVSTPGDSHEQEADRVADEVVSRSAATQVTEENKLNPGSTKPENNASSPQSLQTKISRMAEPEPAATETPEPEMEATAPAETARDNEQGVSAEVEQQIAGLRGQGAQLPEQLRAEMESQFNHDFSSVSIHTGGTADALCKQLSARAFTVGSDIFFAAGEYAPDSQEGKRLLAHELTHVVQQGRGVTRKIMRDAAPSGGPMDDNNFSIQVQGMGSVQDMTINVQVNSAGTSLTMDKIALPAFKIPFHPAPIQYTPGRRSDNEENNQQRDRWKQALAGADGIVSFTQEQIITQLRVTPNGTDNYVFVAGRSNRPEYNFIGNISHIRSELTIPSWGKNAAAYPYQVDHKKELQLGGENDAQSNLWLLIGGTNIAAGQRIHNFLQAVTRLVGEHERDAATANGRAVRDNLKNSNAVLGSCSITFNAAVSNTRYTHADQTLDRRFFWTYEEIASGEQFRVSGSPVRVENIDSLADAGKVFIMPDQSRASGKQFNQSPNISADERNWIDPWQITSKVFWTEETSVTNPNLGQFAIRLQQKNHSSLEQIEDTAINIKRYPGSRFAGYLELDRYFLENYGKYSVAHFSPITISSVDFVGGSGLQLLGKVNPTLGLISGCELDLRVSEGAIEVSKTFSTSDITIPAPLRLDESSLSVFLSSERGLGIEGRVDFGINRLGTGSVRAAASTAQGFALEGEFNFDERLFGQGTTAQVRVGYANQQWSIGGTLTIPEGKVPGIKAATVNVDYSETAGFSARGEAELSVPGVERGTLEITNNEDTGFSIGGAFTLSQGRGIRGGQINARVQEKPDGTGYAVTAHGEAQPDIPGINSNLIVDYNDGAFTAEVSADYSRGMLSGRVNAGVTNRTVNADGSLSATAAPENPLVVYGGGQLTLQIAPWLQGTAGVQFAPNGEITVTGEIGLPSQLEIFARKEINKSIFNIAVQAPIFPGIVAEVGGGLSATAGIGPGVIDQLRLGITYNPAHEDQTRITGDAHLNIPANAGLRLSVRAGIGLGITGASATGGLDIGGTLGIEGAAEAGVHVEWSPTTGLDIRAQLAVHAQPSFTFDIGGYVSVRALGFEVYDNRWQFASYTFGSDYRFGIRLPIHYREGEPFDISLDDVEFDVPNIDTNQLLRGLIARIA